ncbi:hypothetical protein BDB00DRAFT_794551 [Zychaea mexicana]|uniref:uncharacterized protein n=1 Tax=Zychaea mexicana TaxID=64656 RepID=UPI0022FE6053|nr:uncharacterized protein BDB00DRAFT_794551 [Zychaea mexicana]KAI9499578.1 hypothetical protein BDB00DRAFT_794551 [Zychaea mexicana]
MVEYLGHSNTVEDSGNPYLYRPHDTTQPQAVAVAVAETTPPYAGSLEPYFTDIFQPKSRNSSGSALFTRQLTSIGNINSMLAGLQQHCPDSFLESLSGTSSDVSDGTQQQQQQQQHGPFLPGQQYPTPLSTIPAAHARHNSTPPHQQPLIPPHHTFTSNVTYDTITGSSTSFGQDPRDTATGILTNPDNSNCFSWLTSESINTYTTASGSTSTGQVNHHPHHLSHNRTASNCSLPSTTTTEDLPSPASHTNDEQLPPQLYLHDGQFSSCSNESFALSSPVKQPRHSPLITQHSSGSSSSSDFHLLGYGYTGQVQRAQPLFTEEELKDNNEFFPPLQMLQDQQNNNNNRRRRQQRHYRQSSWQQESNSIGGRRRQTLPDTNAERAGSSNSSSSSTSSNALPSQSDLLKEADERPHQCNHCKKGFNRQQDLKRHNKSIHEKQFVHGCSVCQRSFSRHDSLLRHQKKCRSDPSFSSNESTSNNSSIISNNRHYHPLNSKNNNRPHPIQRRSGRLSAVVPLPTATRRHPTLYN